MRNFVSRVSSSYNKYQDFANIVLLVILCFTVFFNSLFINLLEVDDFNSLLHKKSTINLKQILTTNTYGNNEGGNYRPIEVLSHKLDSTIYGYENPLGRHLTNLLIHTLNVLLVYFLVSFITKTRTTGLIASSLYAVLVIHSYSLSPVSWISGRVDLFVTLFYLLSIILFIRYVSNGSILTYSLSLVAFYFSLLSKEMAVTLPLVIVIYSWFFIDENKVNRDINQKTFVRILWIAIAGGVLIFISAFVLTPNFFASQFSPDKNLHPDTIQKIQYYGFIMKSFGVVITVISLAILLLYKLLTQKFHFLTLWYSLPYFLVLLFYFIVRFFVLGDFGGLYLSEDGGAVNFNFNFDAFLRDNLGLAAFFWPVGKEYYETILKLHVNNTFYFYLFSIIAFVLVLFIFFILIKKKQKKLLFGFVWIFITFLPAHNILVSPWYFNQRYLYLPAVGFCLFISILLYKLIDKKTNLSSYLRYSVISFFILIIGVKSFLIIKHNELLRLNGGIIKSFVEDFRRFEPLISDSSRIVFVNYPLTPISSKGCVFIDAYIRDILTLLNYDSNSLKFSFLLFTKDLNEEKLEIKWIDQRSFTIELNNPNKYSIIPSQLSPLDINIRSVHKGLPFHPLIQPLPEVGDSIYAGGASIRMLKLDEKKQKAIVKVDLADSLNASNPNTLFLSFQKGYWDLLKVPGIPFPAAKVQNFDELTPKRIALIVENRLVSSLDSYLTQYKTDLQSEGYEVTVINNVSSSTPPIEIRKLLQNEYKKNQNLTGAVLIGNISALLFNTLEDQGDPYWHDYLADFYYMDLDGIWEDVDNNGVFDNHRNSGNIFWRKLNKFMNFNDEKLPEIWVSRIRADKLTSLGDEISLLKNYFDKNHKYRTGKLTLPEKRAFVISSGVNVLKSDWGAYPDKIYSKIDCVYFQPFMADTLKKYLKSPDGYELGIINAFSAPAVHHFNAFNEGIDKSWWQTKEGRQKIVDYLNNNIIDENDFGLNDIKTIQPKVLFYHLLTSETGRHEIDDYLAGAYVFSGMGLAAIAGTQHSGSVGNHILYNELAARKTIGEAWKNALSWLVEKSEEKITIKYFPNETEILTAGKSNYKAVLIGDGTLKLPQR